MARAGLAPQEAEAALRAVRKLAGSRAGAPFAAPVQAADAPGYATLIARPMDLGTIAQQLEAGAYATLGAFEGREHRLPSQSCGPCVQLLL
jgi:hypothetical protein